MTAMLPHLKRPPKAKDFIDGKPVKEQGPMSPELIMAKMAEWRSFGVKHGYATPTSERAAR